tara:strand:- start:149 stop:523 length:375 start_codon:yes stop_codon:yes gene_type:complete
MDIIPKHIEIKETPDMGLGVFATKDFKKGELIERSYLIFTDLTTGNYDYVFNYPLNRKLNEELKRVLPLGYGCIYNHNDNNNAMWTERKKGFFDFVAVKPIKKGEEICTNYGPAYWKGKGRSKK